MKKRLLALLGAAALLLTACTGSSTKEEDVNKFFEGKDASAYSLGDVNYVASEDLTSADVWTTSKALKEDKTTLAKYEAATVTLFTSLRSQTALSTSVFTKLTSTFAVYNELDKALAEKYGDEIEYLIEDGKVTVSYEGSHTFNSDDDVKFENGAYAFSYNAKYNEVGLLESASLIASYVQKEGENVETFMRTYKSHAELTWTKA